MKTAVLIPTYNEEKAIGAIIDKIRAQKLEVVVVDDGSADQTQKIARSKGAVVIRNEQNLGKGFSLIKGFEYCLKNGFDSVITMDGDGQHCPEDIALFLSQARDSQAGLLIGNRMSVTADMPRLRLLTNKFMSWIISGVAGQKVPDTQCGFRLLKKGLLEKMELRSGKYEIESEMIIKAARLKFNIVSVPIKTIYRGEVSRINPFVDTLRFLRFIIRELWTMPR